MTVREMRKLAKEKGIKKINEKTKEELMEALDIPKEIEATINMEKNNVYQIATICASGNIELKEKLKNELYRRRRNNKLKIKENNKYYEILKKNGYLKK